MPDSKKRRPPPAIESLLRKRHLDAYDYQKEHPNRHLETPRHDGTGVLPTNRGGTYAPLDKEHRAAKYWRGVIGTFISHRMEYDAMDGKAWHLKNWPTGYTFWYNTRESGLVDYYLYGKCFIAAPTETLAEEIKTGFKAPFRSPIEFAFHAWWLYSDEENARTCRCTVCTGRPQREINAVELGHLPAIPRPRRPNPNGPIAGGGGGGGGGAPHVVHVRRDSSNFTRLHYDDFRTSLYDADHYDLPPYEMREKDQRPGVVFRQGEIVWVALDDPISLNRPYRSNLVIKYWSAYISAAFNEQGEKEYHTIFLGAGAGDAPLVPEMSIVPYKAYLLPRNLQQAVDRSLPQNSDQIQNLEEILSLLQPYKRSPINQNARNFQFGVMGLNVALSTSLGISKHWYPNCPEEITLHEEGEREEEDERYVETVFQGMWFGPERIWVKDVVRLLPSWEQLVNEGKTHGMVQPLDGVRTRGLVLYLTAIVDDPDGDKENLSVCGSLYGVADARFVSLPPFRNLLSTEHMPDPPPNSVFQRLTPEGKEIRLPFRYIAGRYYSFSNHRDPMVDNDQLPDAMYSCRSLIPGGIPPFPPPDVDSQPSRREVVSAELGRAVESLKSRWALGSRRFSG